MRFALLGHDEHTLPIAEALHRLGHDVSHIWDAEPCRARLGQLFPRAVRLRDWTVLLESPGIDATVVACGMDPEMRVEQLKRIAQLGGAALVSHPVRQAVLDYFELEMIAAETKAKLVPFCPWRWKPGMHLLREWIADMERSPVGRCEQLVIERAAGERDDANVERYFARDVDLALSLVGDLNSISAMCPRWETIGLANLGVQMTGPAGILVRWSIEPPEISVGLRVSLLGPEGKATLTLPDDATADATLQLPAGATANDELADDRSTEATLEAFVAALRGEPAWPDWHAAARGLELADSIELSLRKGKTIPLYNTVPSEQGTFKGVMAAAGCFMLFASLGLLLLALVLARFGVPHADKLPYAVAALLIIFLALQTLRFVFPRSS